MTEQMCRDIDKEVQNFKMQLESCKVLKIRVQPNISSDFIKYLHNAIKLEKKV